MIMMIFLKIKIILILLISSILIFKKVLLSYFLLKLLQHSHTVLKKFLKFLNAFKDIIIFLFNEIVSFLINHSFFRMFLTSYLFLDSTNIDVV